MRAISRSPFFYSRILPLIWVGACAGLAVFALTMNNLAPSMWMLWVEGALVLAVFFLAPVVFFFIPRKISFASEVLDAGDALIVRQWGQQARIALADIASVYARRYPIPQGAFYAVVALHTPCCFGRVVRFFPLDERKFFSFDSGLAQTFSFWQPQVIKDLMERISQTRGKQF